MKKIILGLFVIVVIGVTIFATHSIVSSEINLQIQYSSSVQSEPSSTKQAESIRLTYNDLLPLNNNYLVLVNGDYEVTSNLFDKTDCASNYISVLNIDIRLNKDALIALQELFKDAAKSKGFKDFFITQGFRTYDMQQLLYETAEDKSFVALPNHSEHQTGFAADISYKEVNIGNSKQGTWLAENAHKNGFILRYPEGKTQITGIQYEPWHYRYVGQPHATISYTEQLCLEEYIDFLKDNKTISATVKGIKYTVFYLEADDVVEIPSTSEYTVSIDNTGGLIVTTRDSN